MSFGFGYKKEGVKVFFLRDNYVCDKLLSPNTRTNPCYAVHYNFTDDCQVKETWTFATNECSLLKLRKSCLINSVVNNTNVFKIFPSNEMFG